MFCCPLGPNQVIKGARREKHMLIENLWGKSSRLPIISLLFCIKCMISLLFIMCHLHYLIFLALAGFFVQHGVSCHVSFIFPFLHFLWFSLLIHYLYYLPVSCRHGCRPPRPRPTSLYFLVLFPHLFSFGSGHNPPPPPLLPLRWCCPRSNTACSVAGG